LLRGPLGGFVGRANNGTTWQIERPDLAVELIIYELKRGFFLWGIYRKRG